MGKFRYFNCAGIDNHIEEADAPSSDTVVQVVRGKLRFKELVLPDSERLCFLKHLNVLNNSVLNLAPLIQYKIPLYHDSCTEE